MISFVVWFSLMYGLCENQSTIHLPRHIGTESENVMYSAPFVKKKEKESKMCKQRTP